MAILQRENPVPETAPFITPDHVAEALRILGFEDPNQVISIKCDGRGFSAVIIPSLRQIQHLKTFESGTVRQLEIRIPVREEDETEGK